MDKRQIRRRDRALSPEESGSILESGLYGFLATVGADGQPYGVPLSYVCLDGDVYFHCALEGRKIEHLRAQAQVCFTVVSGVETALDKAFTTFYESVMVFGRAEEILKAEEKKRALLALAEKYTPQQLPQAPDYIDRFLQRTGIWAVRVEYLSGKAHKKD